MKIILASIALMGLSFGSAYAQCQSGCSSKAAKSSCSSQESCDSQEKSCGSSCGEKAVATSTKISFAKKLAKMSAKERKQIVEAMGYLSKNCPMGSRMGSTTKTLDELYVGAIANLKAVHASGKLQEADKAQVAKSLGMLQKAHNLNAETLNGIALLVGTPATKKADCGEGDCGEGSGSAKGGCDSDDGCVGCAGSCGDKAVATSDCSTSIAYSKRLCASWAKAQKEMTKLSKEKMAKLQAAVATLAPLGMLETSLSNFAEQKKLVRAAVKAMPCSSKIGCPGTAKVCDSGSQAVASVYAHE